MDRTLRGYKQQVVSAPLLDTEHVSQSPQALTDNDEMTIPSKYCSVWSSHHCLSEVMSNNCRLYTCSQPSTSSLTK